VKGPLAWCAWALMAVFTLSGETFTVNTTEDLANPGSGVVSLRSALAATQLGTIPPNAGDDYLITFDASLFAKTNAVTVTLTNQTTLSFASMRVRVQGRTDGKRVTLLARGGSAPVLDVGAKASLAFADLDVAFKTDQEAPSVTLPSAGVWLRAAGSFALRRCSFAGTGSKNGHLVHASGTDATALGVVEQCSFTGARCGTLSCGGARRYRFVNCTFSGVTAVDHPGVVSLAGDGAYPSLFVACTLESCQAKYAGLYVPTTTHANPRVWVADSLLVYNKNRNSAGCDVYDAGKAVRCAYTGLSSYYFPQGTETVFTAVEDLSLTPSSEVFLEDAGAYRVAGTLRAYRAVNEQGALAGKGAYLLHDEDWTNVCATVSLRNKSLSQIVLSGHAGLARTLLNEDVASRPVWASGVDWSTATDYVQVPDLRIVPGSFAVAKDAEASREPGLCEVTSLADEAENGPTQSQTDGELTLREAVRFLADNPGWRDADGNARIVFSDALFDVWNRRVCTFESRQIEIDGIGSGTLSIVGSEVIQKQFVLDGAGEHRLFYVAPGNRVVFQGITFTNAVGEVAGRVGASCGGALCNAGSVTLRDCVFAGCRAPSTGFSRGGALVNGAGATAVVERCSFTGCSAMLGGAIANDAGGDLIVYGATFADNAAVGTTGGTGACGGAVYAVDAAARTALVNCTLAGNSAEASGGGLWAAGPEDVPRVFLLNVVAVGNTAPGAGGDVATRGRVLVRTSWLGDCSAAADDALFDVDRTVSRLGLVAADVFADYTVRGAPIAHAYYSVGVVQTYFTLSKNVIFAPSYVRTLSLGQGLYYAASTTAFPVPLWGNPSLGPVTPIRRDDLFGARDAAAKPYPGSADYYDTPVWPTPDPNDPLCVKDGTDAVAFLAAVQYAAAHPEAASNGCFTIRFAEPYDIGLPADVTLSAFAQVPLRICGPVTFRASTALGSRHRLFTVQEDNRLILENVVLADGHDDEKGGAIYVEGGSLTASNCVFTGCTAGPGTYFAMGGAVALWTNPDAEDAHLPQASFTDCSFENCRAENHPASGDIPELPGFGHAVYQEQPTFGIYRDCRFDNKTVPGDYDVVFYPYVCVEKGSGARCYYGTVAEALARECTAGDTLVRLSADAPVPKDAALPPGVSFRDEADGGFSLLLLANTQQTLSASGRDYYAATLVTDAQGRATGVRVALKAESVIPLMTGPEATVDLTGSAGTVSVSPANVKPGLWYGLGRSATPTGDFTVETWLQADADGTLPGALTAPKKGAAGFYRVRVTDCPEAQP